MMLELLKLSTSCFMYRFGRVAPEPSKGFANDGISPASSPPSSIKLERSESLLSRNLASKVRVVTELLSP